tara:strand:- start:708 stop:1079 length:372 start_codon:yes stop_codon:yes gene_type:complete
LERVYHSWEKWEDHKNGFYNNIGGKNKKILETKVFELFGNENICRENMYKVVKEWRYSCEHNLSNNSINKIAYIGQASCCIYGGVPSTITMDCWSKINKEHRNRADLIAKEVLLFWEEEIYNA